MAAVTHGGGGILRIGAATLVNRVKRGGSYRSEPVMGRSANRMWGSRRLHANNIGFRLVVRRKK